VTAMTSKEHRGNLFLAITLLTVIGSVANAQPRFVTIRGKDFISRDNRLFLLKAINLGNRLLA
jgi:hypothetical protein